MLYVGKMTVPRQEESAIFYEKNYNKRNRKLPNFPSLTTFWWDDNDNDNDNNKNDDDNDDEDHDDGDNDDDDDDDDNNDDDDDVDDHKKDFFMAPVSDICPWVYHHPPLFSGEVLFHRRVHR